MLAKAVFLSLFVIQFAGAPTFGQEISRKTTERTFLSTRDNLEYFTRQPRRLFGHSAEGGTAELFFTKRKELAFVRLWLYGESGKSKFEFLPKPAGLDYCKVENHQYNMPFYMDENWFKKNPDFPGEPFDQSKTRISEESYYFQNGKLVHWDRPDHETQHPDRQEIEEKEEALLELFNAVLKAPLSDDN